MPKILLAEDDNNLREIYEARLQAEGYVVISSGDGEEALVLAKDQLPDLIISDVMMPKISGFEMLDIVRNTDGLKNTKVIMLTALGQSEDQERATKLGADRYLVKSQVTLEDIVRVAKELLPTDGDNAPATNEPVSKPEEVPEPQQINVEPAAMPAQEPPKDFTSTSPEEATTETNNASSNDQLISNALDDLSVNQPDESQQPSVTSEDPSTPNNPLTTPDNSSLDTSETQILDSESQSETAEIDNMNDQINDFAKDNSNSEEQVSLEPPPPDSVPAYNQNETQDPINPTSPPMSIPIPINQPGEDADSSVLPNPPENVIPPSSDANSVSPATDDQTKEANAEINANIDPTNITL